MTNASQAASRAAMNMPLAPELFSGLLAIAVDAVIATDDEQRIIFFNEGAERIFGWTAAEVGGQSLGVLLPTRFRAGHADLVHGFGKAHGHARVMGERHQISGVRKCGEEFPAEAAIQQFTVDGRAVYAAVLRDITDRAAAEAERERLLADAESSRRSADEANRAKGAFLAVMSHELRTPLNAIGGYAELIELGLRGPVTEQQIKDLQRIRESQKHLLGLISQVLNHSRLEAGHIRYELADVPAAEALAAAEGLIVPQARSRGLTYVFEKCEPGVRARADQGKLQQILLNLLTNAIKFTAPGGSIRVAATAREGAVAFSVSDSGVGIPANMLAALFEPFVQLRTEYSPANDGVGLGLAISRDLARGMGGDLTAESAPGIGSTFTLRLPSAEGLQGPPPQGRRAHPTKRRGRR
jgi:PAS domain S-box-containing protein